MFCVLHFPPFHPVLAVLCENVVKRSILSPKCCANQFACWRFGALHHDILKNADCQCVDGTICVLDPKRDATVRTHRIHNSLHVLCSYTKEGSETLSNMKEEIDCSSRVDVISSLIKARFEIRTRTQFDQFTVSLSCHGNTMEKENAF